MRGEVLVAAIGAIAIAAIVFFVLRRVFRKELALPTPLEGSIDKWRGIVEGTMRDDGPLNEPLCHAFLKDKDDCTGCPVKRRTGRDCCDGSPYDDWSVAITVEDMAKAAREQLAFLVSLRPAPRQLPVDARAKSLSENIQ